MQFESEQVVQSPPFTYPLIYSLAVPSVSSLTLRYRDLNLSIALHLPCAIQTSPAVNLPSLHCRPSPRSPPLSPQWPDYLNPVYSRPNRGRECTIILPSLLDRSPICSGLSGAATTSLSFSLTFNAPPGTWAVFFENRNLVRCCQHTGPEPRQLI